MPRQRQAALWAAAVFALLSAAAATSSRGFLEGDACTHYLIARFSLQDVRELLGVWGRPLVTALYAPGAQLGVTAVRLTSLVVALLAALLTYRVAVGLGQRGPAIAVICLLGQPLFFLHSFSELTELPFAALLIAAFWAYQRRRFLVMAVLISISPLARPEGYGFMGLAALALLAHRRWWWGAVLPLPLLVWSYSGWVLVSNRQNYGHGALNWLLWLRHAWPYSQASAYPPGPLLGFFWRLPVVVGPAFFPFLFLGIYAMTRGSWRRLDHDRRCQLLVVALPLSVLAGHSVLWWCGRMASSGELRYLLVTAPMWALLCAAGWQWAQQHLRWPAPLRWVALAALLPLLANAAYPVVPLKAYDHDLLGQRVAAWYAQEPALAADFPRVMATSPSIYFSMDIHKSNARRAVPCSQRLVLHPPEGVLLVWDEQYGQRNSNRDLCVSPEQIRAGGWRHAWTFRTPTAVYEVYLSPRSASGAPTPPLPHRTQLVRS